MEVDELIECMFSVDHSAEEEGEFLKGRNKCREIGEEGSIIAQRDDDAIVSQGSGSVDGEKNFEMIWADVMWDMEGDDENGSQICGAENVRKWKSQR